MTADPSLVERIDAVLPQTQCRRCGYDGCRPYARAIAAGDADIDRCPPGGDDGVIRLSRLTGRPVVSLDPTRGSPQPLVLAAIDEERCIGCTLCIEACPVDAIVGAAKRMHDVASDLCTGCELCVPRCPVDCIVLVPAPFVWDDARAAAARERHRRRLARIAAASGSRPVGGRDARREGPIGEASPPTADADGRRALIDTVVTAAIERARARRAARPARAVN